MTDVNHNGHRKRMRDRLNRDGIDGFAPHEVLEMLLYPLIPLKDTNVLAHKLIAEFGTLAAVLEARPEELAKVEGLSEANAQSLSMYHHIFRYYRKNKQKGKQMLSVNTIYQFGMMLFEECPFEEMYVLCLDSRGKLKGYRRFTNMNVMKVSISPRDIAEIAFSFNCASVILLHSHPGGVGLPSQADDEFTKMCYTVLRGLGVHVLEHMIIADGGEYYSYYVADRFVAWLKEYNDRFNIKFSNIKELKIKK